MSMDSANSYKTGYFDSSRLSHAYIVSGDLAGTLAAAAVCAGTGAVPCGACKHCGKASRGTHPDIMPVDKEKDKRDILVEQIRALRKDVIVIPNEAGRKAYIVNDAELMNRSAQNALLQVLEEPPTHAVFILNTDNPAALLPTVRSRCVELTNLPEADAVLETERSSNAEDVAGDFFTALDGGNVALITFMFQLEKLDKETFLGFLSAAREQVVLRLRAPAPEVTGADSGAPRGKLAGAERILLKAGEMLDLNVNIGHLSGMICASLLTVDS